MDDSTRLLELEDELADKRSQGAEPKQLRRLEAKITQLKKCVELSQQIEEVEAAIKKSLGTVGEMLEISSPEVGSRKFAEGDLNKLRLYRAELVRELKLLRAQKKIKRIKI